MTLLSVALVCWGQEAPPTPTDPGEARAMMLFENGSQLYDEGQYEAAIVAFRSALDNWPAATELHFNISNCYERLGRLSEAVAALNLYRATAAPEERETIERRLRALEQRISTESPPTPPPAPLPVAPVEPLVGRHPRWAVVGSGVGAIALGGLGAVFTYDRAQAAVAADDASAYSTARAWNGVSFGVGGLGLGLAALGIGWQSAVAGGGEIRWSPVGLSGSW